MPEDSGKKRYIRDFLQQVKSGTGFIDDIRIERVIRLPGTNGEGSTARSLSGRKVFNVTQLLEDDINHTFDDGFFTFRFVAAVVGSGKTSLLTYLYELIKTQPTYETHSVVVQFQLSDIFSRNRGNSFIDRLYSHILADTFWQLLHNSNLSISVKNIAEKVLDDFFETDEVARLKSLKSLMPFRNKFKKYVVENVDGLEQFFFHVINEVSCVDPKFSFIYLADELDSLARFPNELQETRLLFKELIRRCFQDFKSKIRLLIYLVGTSDNVGSFIAEDSVIKSLVDNTVINLNKGYRNEFDIIRAKILERIEGAYSRYKNFPKAWQEIQTISFNPASTLREFCQSYGTVLLEIHEKYFKEEPEQSFEGDARQLVEAECKHQWASFLNQKAYELSASSTTTVKAGRAFDCYVELLHNGSPTARAFGEAKNYELLSSHFETFKQWLDDVKFLEETPDDLAFMIAPSCPPLLQRKLKLQNIQFIQSDKKIKKAAIEALEANSTTNFVVQNQPVVSQVELVVITNSGKAYPIKVQDFFSKSEHDQKILLVKLLPDSAQSERVVAYFELSKLIESLFVVLLTNQGRIKRLPASELTNHTKHSRILIKLKDDDQLEYVNLTQTSEQLVVGTTNGRLLRFEINNENLPITGRISQGKLALRLRGREQVIGCVTLSTDDNLLLVTEQGYGKRLPVSALRRVNRGDLGTQAIQFKTSTDNLVAMVPASRKSEVMLVTSGERVVRLRLEAVKLWGKDGIGDHIAKMNPEEKIISVAVLV